MALNILFVLFWIRKMLIIHRKTVVRFAPGNFLKRVMYKITEAPFMFNREFINLPISVISFKEEDYLERKKGE